MENISLKFSSYEYFASESLENLGIYTHSDVSCISFQSHTSVLSVYQALSILIFFCTDLIITMNSSFSPEAQVDSVDVTRAPPLENSIF